MAEGAELDAAQRRVSQGWPVAVAYFVGFFVMLAVRGWHPDAPHWWFAILSFHSFLVSLNICNIK
jgi:hypothetical protein